METVLPENNHLKIRKITAYTELIFFDLTGYESQYSYKVHTAETETAFSFIVEKYKREIPYLKKWTPIEKDRERYEDIISQGLSFGVFIDDVFAGISLLEFSGWNNTLNIELIEVIPELRRKGIGKLMIMEIVRIAEEKKARTIRLETQNTNGDAIDFYKKQGFTFEGIDLSLYTNTDAENGEVAVFMKRRAL